MRREVLSGVFVVCGSFVILKAMNIIRPPNWADLLFTLTAIAVVAFVYRPQQRFEQPLLAPSPVEINNMTRPILADPTVMPLSTTKPNTVGRLGGRQRRPSRPHHGHGPRTGPKHQFGSLRR